MTPSFLHHLQLKDLSNIHKQHCCTAGPGTYRKMFESLRQHLCFYHGFPFYEIPNTRLKQKEPQSTQPRKRRKQSKKRKRQR